MSEEIKAALALAKSRMTPEQLAAYERSIRRQMELNPNPGWIYEVTEAFPKDRYLVVERGADGYKLMRVDGMMVIVSGSVEEDRKRWVHVSCSFPGRLPSYQDLCELKADFLGDDKVAYQVFARRKDHVNVHPYVLHLWCCLDGPDPLPDMTQGTGMI